MADKNKQRSDAAISFIEGFLGRKENKSPVGNIVRGAQDRKAKLEEAKKKARGY